MDKNQSPEEGGLLYINVTEWFSGGSRQQQIKKEKKKKKLNEWGPCIYPDDY